MAIKGSPNSPTGQNSEQSQPLTVHSTQHKLYRRNSGSSTKRPARPVIKRQKSGNSKKRVSIVDPESQSSEELDDMTTSFPQFCTSCEKQIITPNNTLLYCSESCRRRDQNKPLASSVPTTSHLLSRPLSSTQSNASSEYLSAARDIIPQRSPTITSNRFSFTDLFSAGGQEATDDESHAEDSQSETRPVRNHRRQDSEAARYLRQFQSPSFIAENSTKPLRRPNPQSRASTYSLAPSLTHSPSPGTSPASFTPLSSLPLAYSRPLPPRANPYSQSYGAKGINLVTPHHAGPQSVPHIDLSNLPGLKAQPTTGTNVGAEELPNEIIHENNNMEDDSDDAAARFEKKQLTFGSSAPAPGRGALRSLFRFDNMQAPPS